MERQIPNWWLRVEAEEAAGWTVYRSMAREGNRGWGAALPLQPSYLAEREQGFCAEFLADWPGTGLEKEAKIAFLSPS